MRLWRTPSDGEGSLLDGAGRLRGWPPQGAGEGAGSSSEFMKSARSGYLAKKALPALSIDGRMLQEHLKSNGIPPLDFFLPLCLSTLSKGNCKVENSS